MRLTYIPWNMVHIVGIVIGSTKSIKFTYIILSLFRTDRNVLKNIVMIRTSIRLLNNRLTTRGIASCYINVKYINIQ